ncbi:MAG: 4Fe-4S binding protein [Bacteroidales bacterium]|nr:4Fe-4S binding protein [Bacteroidales bacterium]
MENRRQKIRKSILIITFLIFPAVFYYFSPYLIIEATHKGIISGSFVVFVLMFVGSLLFGRAYCAWICPASGIQEQIIQIKNKKVKKGNIIKWLIWLPWISYIAILAIKNGGYKIIDPFYQTTYGLSIGSSGALLTYFSVLSLIVIPAFIVGRKSFCHHICWMAPFMIIGRKLANLIKVPSLRLYSASDRCIHCHTCTYQCPMSLPVEKMVKENNMEHSECILCGTCIDNCKIKAIGFEFN